MVSCHINRFYGLLLEGDHTRHVHLEVEISREMKIPPATRVILSILLFLGNRCMVKYSVGYQKNTSLYSVVKQYEIPWVCCVGLVTFCQLYPYGMCYIWCIWLSREISQIRPNPKVFPLGKMIDMVKIVTRSRSSDISY